jgi:hypothetical protein
MGVNAVRFQRVVVFQVSCVKLCRDLLGLSAVVMKMIV